jgi:hypothetical protein
MIREWWKEKAFVELSLSIAHGFGTNNHKEFALVPTARFVCSWVVVGMVIGRCRSKKNEKRRSRYHVTSRSARRNHRLYTLIDRDGWQSKHSMLLLFSVANHIRCSRRGRSSVVTGPLLQCKLAHKALSCSRGLLRPRGWLVLQTRTKEIWSEMSGLKLVETAMLVTATGHPC